MEYFIFNNIDSRDMGVLIQSMPSLIRAPKLYDEVYVPGRDGAVVTEQGYGCFPLPLNIGIRDLSKLDEILAWLNGEGKLIISNDIDKYRKVNFLDQIDYEYLKRFRQATVNIYCYPFRHSRITNEISISSKQIIVNRGTLPCKPRIVLSGSGNVLIYVNGELACEITTVDESIVIDGENNKCYKGDLLMNRRKIGEYPLLNVGENEIEIVGEGITNRTVVLNERWL